MKVLTVSVCCAVFASIRILAAISLDAPGHVYTDKETPTAHGGVPGASWNIVDWRGRDVGVSGVFGADGGTLNCSILTPSPT